MLGEYLLTAALVVSQPPSAAALAAAAPAPAPTSAYAPPGPVSAYAPPVQAPTAAAPVNGNGVAANGDCNACDPCAEEPAAPKYLLECLLSDTCFAKKGCKLYGWLQQSYTPSSASERNFPVALNDQANEYLLNQVWLGGAREVDPSKKCFQLGGRVDFFWGSDARYTIPRGLFDYQVRSGELYPFDVYQFYTEAFLPGVGPEGTTVRTGRFATHISYEVVQAPDTPFVSRSYLFMNNPFTHTGVWAVTPLNDTWSVGNGVATGADTFIDPANQPTYLGQLRYAPKDGPTQVLFNTMITDPRYDVREAFPFYNAYNLQVIHKATEAMTYVLDSTYSHVDGVPGLGFADWYGAANYLFYNLSDNLTSQTRIELFHDVKGFRTGFNGLYTGVTTGMAWRPVDWLLLRPGVRYDINDRSRAFEGDYDLFTAFADMIVRW